MWKINKIYYTNGIYAIVFFNILALSFIPFGSIYFSHLQLIQHKQSIWDRMQFEKKLDTISIHVSMYHGQSEIEWNGYKYDIQKIIDSSSGTLRIIVYQDVYETLLLKQIFKWYDDLDDQNKNTEHSKKTFDWDKHYVSQIIIRIVEVLHHFHFESRFCFWKINPIPYPPQWC